ncbi:uncharacterized protein K489DRAFT_270544 [Dissoconium aciculare CBS 342.82]|uniref:Uncharacterized protein n=1 Tax=Dissoconium aciculare CBS 342.82 TaxID=1314786 RepID=A0A6J3LZP4_9PEZI|nr:uncharacterized protein K489DRAFT_270544 [Dissoconium aciculare CBS 342.82]KAF1821265.1 hypothetical protein K489DRAFT_270544 [Dissoconium aciculare CBS 342.82]
MTVTVSQEKPPDFVVYLMNDLGKPEAKHNTEGINIETRASIPIREGACVWSSRVAANGGNG